MLSWCKFKTWNINTCKTCRWHKWIRWINSSCRLRCCRKTMRSRWKWTRSNTRYCSSSKRNWGCNSRLPLNSRIKHSNKPCSPMNQMLAQPIINWLCRWATSHPFLKVSKHRFLVWDMCLLQNIFKTQLILENKNWSSKRYNLLQIMEIKIIS